MKSRISKRSFVAAAVSAALVCMSLSLKNATAHRFLSCDDGEDWITWSEECSSCALMYIDENTIPPGSARWNELFAAMDAWKNVTGSTFKFFGLPDLDNTFEIRNGENEVFFSKGDGPGGTLATTFSITDSCRPLDDADIKEADLQFDIDENWWTGSWFYNEEDKNHHPNLRMVALHELGHVLGLSIGGNQNHEDSVMATMNSKYPGGGPIGPAAEIAPLADDRGGLRRLYFDIYNINLKPDLVGSNYKRTTPGESDRVNSPVSASRGVPITFEFTFMNIGTIHSGSFSIGFYLSKDRTITTKDILIGSNSGASVSAGGLVTSSRTLTIPSSVPPGFYWIGVVLDKNRVVSELSESNNGLAMPRLTVVN